MKSFWGSFLGTLAGVFVTCLFIFFVIIGVFVTSVSKISSREEKTVKVKSNSVLHIKFDSEIIERSPKNPFEGFDFNGFDRMPMGLNTILADIEKAKGDNNIKGIYLDLSSIPAGIATLEEIRNALIDFKTSKKFIVAYSEGYAQGSYYLATAADKIYLNPQGMVDFKGLSRQIMFYKKLLDKLEVNVQIFRHGKFKSATEPFFLDKMSKENREQTSAYIHSIWNYLLEGISKQRNISVEELNHDADNMLITDANSALQYKLVDQLVYKDEMLDILKELSGAKSAEKINSVELRKYSHAPNYKYDSYKSKIALVYAQGDIIGGEGEENTIGSERISKAIREARLDENVKAIVLRVNSPGGSSLASDVIWREMALAKKAKPVVVSMGDVAASGGYYISCAADAIVAHPNTITGSIGVFGVFPNAKGLFENKFGITMDTVNTNKHSDILSPYRAAGKDESEVIQKWIENVYTDFITKVGEGRSMTPAQVDSIAQGRVWSAIDGKKIGLVDEFGGIKDAIALAAKKAKLKDYSILELPKQKDAFEELFKNIMDGETSSSVSFWQLVTGNWQQQLISRFLLLVSGFQPAASSQPPVASVQTLLKYQGVQMRLPYDVVIY